jgi:hypothetical protein
VATSLSALAAEWPGSQVASGPAGRSKGPSPSARTAFTAVCELCPASKSPRYGGWSREPAEARHWRAPE